MDHQHVDDDDDDYGTRNQLHNAPDHPTRPASTPTTSCSGWAEIPGDVRIDIGNDAPNQQPPQRFMVNRGRHDDIDPGYETDASYGSECSSVPPPRRRVVTTHPNTIATGHAHPVAMVGGGYTLDPPPPSQPDQFSRRRSRRLSSIFGRRKSAAHGAPAAGSAAKYIAQEAKLKHIMQKEKRMVLKQRSLELNLINASIVFCVLVFLGPIGFWIAENDREDVDWDYFTSIYYSFITITTVGYGDFVPTTDAGKIYGFFYCLFGIGTLAFIWGTMIDYVTRRAHLEWDRQRIRRAQKILRVLGDSQPDISQPQQPQSQQAQPQPQPPQQEQQQRSGPLPQEQPPPPPPPLPQQQQQQRQTEEQTQQQQEEEEEEEEFSANRSSLGVLYILQGKDAPPGVTSAALADAALSAASAIATKNGCCTATTTTTTANNAPPPPQEAPPTSASTTVTATTTTTTSQTAAATPAQQQQQQPQPQPPHPTSSETSTTAATAAFASASCSGADAGAGGTPLAKKLHFRLHALRLMQRNRRLLIIMVLFLAYLHGAAGIFVALEGWRYIDAWYFCYTTLFTVGSVGAFVPTGTNRIATLFFLAFGLLIEAALIASVGALVVDLNEMRFEQNMRRVRRWYVRKRQEHSQKKHVRQIRQLHQRHHYPPTLQPTTTTTTSPMMAPTTTTTPPPMQQQRQQQQQQQNPQEGRTIGSGTGTGTTSVRQHLESFQNNRKNKSGSRKRVDFSSDITTTTA